MSHDLRSPLNSVLGFSELLTQGLSGNSPEKTRKKIQSMHATGTHLLHLIDDVLDTAKSDAGRLVIHMEDTLPTELLTRAIEIFVQRQPDASRAIPTELQPDYPLCGLTVRDWRKRLRISLSF